MNKDRYIALIAWAKKKPVREQVLCGVTKWIPIFIGGFYIFTILFCMIMYPVALPRLILRPLLCFSTVTVLRNIVKAPRPYDVYGYIPLCGYRPGKNRSFPSRHTASAVILALEINIIFGGLLGVFCIILSFVMATFRVLCGNHFIKDVVAGLVLAVLFNCL